MIHQTRGIVFHHIKYSETSIIARVFTEKLGLQSYIIRGVRKQKSKIRTGYFQPLSLLEMTVYYKEKSNLQNLKEVKSAYHFHTIPFDIYKSTIALFISEILLKSIKEEVSNPELFEFIYEMAVHLDKLEDNYQDFHLYFMIHLSRYLGFYPQGAYSDEYRYFDMQEGHFIKAVPEHILYLSNDLSRVTAIIKDTNPFEQKNLHLNAGLRRSLLDKYIQYYKIHLQGMQEINAHQVLKEVFG